MKERINIPECTCYKGGKCPANRWGCEECTLMCDDRKKEIIDAIAQAVVREIMAQMKERDRLKLEWVKR